VPDLDLLPVVALAGRVRDMSGHKRHRGLVVREQVVDIEVEPNAGLLDPAQTFADGLDAVEASGEAVGPRDVPDDLVG